VVTATLEVVYLYRFVISTVVLLAADGAFHVVLSNNGCVRVEVKPNKLLAAGKGRLPVLHAGFGTVDRRVEVAV
jgi:hypothetical protein